MKTDRLISFLSTRSKCSYQTIFCLQQYLPHILPNMTRTAHLSSRVGLRLNSRPSRIIGTICGMLWTISHLQERTSKARQDGIHHRMTRVLAPGGSACANGPFTAKRSHHHFELWLTGIKAPAIPGQDNHSKALSHDPRTSISRSGCTRQVFHLTQPLLCH